MLGCSQGPACVGVSCHSTALSEGTEGGALALPPHPACRGGSLSLWPWLWQRGARCAPRRTAHCHDRSQPRRLLDTAGARVRQAGGTALRLRTTPGTWPQGVCLCRLGSVGRADVGLLMGPAALSLSCAVPGSLNARSVRLPQRTVILAAALEKQRWVCPVPGAWLTFLCFPEHLHSLL